MMKYMLAVPVMGGNAWRHLFYQPSSILLNAPSGFVLTQDEAKRFDTEAEAKAALDDVVVILKELYAPIDPMGALRGFQTEMKFVRENAKVIPTPAQYVLRLPIIINGQNAFEYYQAEAIHVLPSGKEFKVSFTDEFAKAKRFATPEEAAAAIPEAVQKNQNQLRMCAVLTEEDILAHGERYRTHVEVAVV